MGNMFKHNQEKISDLILDLMPSMSWLIALAIQNDIDSIPKVYVLPFS
jgi:hypothetical protein